MKSVIAFLFLLFPATAFAGSYFYQHEEVWGARGWVVENVTTSDGRSGIMLRVGTGPDVILPCSSTASRWDEQLQLDTAGIPCRPDLTDSCASRETSTGSFSQFSFNRTRCTNGSAGQCVSVAGGLDTLAYLAEGAFTRPVVDRLYELPGHLCN